MALTAAQIAALNEWSANQPKLSQGQIDGNTAHDIALGTLLNNGSGSADVYRDELGQTNFTIPTPVSMNIDVPVITALAPGRIVSAYVIISGESMSNTSATASAYTAVVRRFNNTPASLTFAVSLQTGLTAGNPLRLPTGAQAALFTSGKSYSLTATGNGLVINTTTVTSSFANAPGVGDWVIANSGAAATLGGATNANVGLYAVVNSSATQVSLTKQCAVTAPINVAAAAVIAGDASTWQIVRQTEASFSAGDVLGIRVAVPAVTTASSVTANWSVQMRLRYT